MPEYILYLDESETFTSSGDKYFAIGGVIVPASADAVISGELDLLKMRLWNHASGAQQNILHEKEIMEAHHARVGNNSCYAIFRQQSKITLLYNNLSRILRQQKITTIGVCLDLSRLNQLYGANTNPKLTIALQMLLENYCHFLLSKQATGDICYESLREPENQGIRHRFYELEALGTMYYSSRLLQTHIGNIHFRLKSENLPGLQLADFIPNTIARVAAQLPPKHTAFKATVLRQLYDGQNRNSRRFGFKVIP